MGQGEAVVSVRDYDFISHLTRFCRALREHGLLVGPQETADAIAAVERAGADVGGADLLVAEGSAGVAAGAVPDF